MSFKDFKSFMRDNATDYKFIFYDNKSDSKHDLDKLKVAKAVMYKSMELSEEKDSK